MKLVERIGNFGLKRMAMAGLALGLVTMAFDAGIAHFAGRPLRHWAQAVPVGFGAVGLGLLAAVFHLEERRLLKIARGVAATAVVVGLAGSSYHALALVELLRGGGALDAGMVAVALAVAPPMLAPGAFAGLGAALWALASPRVGLTLAAGRHATKLATA